MIGEYDWFPDLYAKVIEEGLAKRAEGTSDLIPQFHERGELECPDST